MSNLYPIFERSPERQPFIKEREVLEALPMQLLLDFIEELRIKRTELDRLEALAKEVLDSGDGEAA